MVEPPFKVGEEIECVKLRYGISPNKTYTVLGILYHNYEYMVAIRNDLSIEGTYYASRFSKVITDLSRASCEQLSTMIMRYAED